MNLQTSIRRTVVPMVMGWVAHLPVAQFVDVEQVEAAVEALHQAVSELRQMMFEHVAKG